MKLNTYLNEKLTIGSFGAGCLNVVLKTIGGITAWWDHCSGSCPTWIALVAKPFGCSLNSDIIFLSLILFSIYVLKQTKKREKNFYWLSLEINSKKYILPIAYNYWTKNSRPNKANDKKRAQHVCIFQLLPTVYGVKMMKYLNKKNWDFFVCVGAITNQE